MVHEPWVTDIASSTDVAAEHALDHHLNRRHTPEKNHPELVVEDVACRRTACDAWCVASSRIPLALAFSIALAAACFASSVPSQAARWNVGLLASLGYTISIRIRRPILWVYMMFWACRMMHNSSSIEVVRKIIKRSSTRKKKMVCMRVFQTARNDSLVYDASVNDGSQGRNDSNNPLVHHVS